STNAVGEDFPNEDPDDGALPHCVRCHKREQTGEEPPASAVGVETVRCRTKAQDVANGADQHEFAAAEVVNSDQGNQGEDEKGESYGDRLEQSGGFVGAGHLKDAAGVIKNGIDSRELVEGGDGDCHRDRLCIFLLEKIFRQVVVSQIKGALDRGDFLFHTPSVRPACLKYAPGFCCSSLGN